MSNGVFGAGGDYLEWETNQRPSAEANFLTNERSSWTLLGELRMSPIGLG
ncbi:hypothetical protein SAMD00023353_0102250 [Rosellinia necatrix]|uniref:Uncharacterized protein n=1 Tax=Rosellinia necatrix TaxID=77044 RepID=A0A1S8A4T6_ROSNE|nr:hypothetical protein SAMD00023353_0102250 [Rosellinia necatrix]